MGFINSFASFLIFFTSLTSFTPWLENFSINNLLYKEVEVMVVGDIMMHKPVTYAGYNYKTKQFNFDSFFSEVKPIFLQSDWVIGNLETPLGGEDLGFSGYPRFNAPKELASSLKQAGFNVLTTANNHSLDKWEKGLVNTLIHLDEFEILHTGTARTQEEREKPLILEANQIKIGLIAYTYGTNGLPVPKNKPYLVNLLDISQVEKDVQILREENVDYIMAMVHFGNEYHRFPSEEQKQWTKDLYKFGVDFVLGSHPHVVQPIEISEDDANKAVIYSLGNFISDQRWEWKDYGLILHLILEKNVIKNETRIKEIKAIPTYVQKDRSKGRVEYRIIPIIEQNELINKTIKANGESLLRHVFNEK